MSLKLRNTEIPLAELWASALIVTQSFLYGYCLVCVNPCLLTGDNNSGSDCYNGSDSSCPEGTIYNDIKLSTSMCRLNCNLNLRITQPLCPLNFCYVNV